MQRYKLILCNGEEGRPRAGWRALIFLALWLILSGILNRSVGAWLSAMVPLPVQMMASIMFLIATLAAAWIALRFLDRRPLTDLGIRLHRSWWVDLAFGLCLGIMLMALVFVVEWLAGWITIAESYRVTLDGVPFWAGFLGSLTTFICVGIYEEIVFRGYLLRNLAEGLNTPRIGPRSAILASWLFSSLLFSLWHVSNPSSSLASTAYLLLAGMLLGMGYIFTRSLAIPIGLHITWNFVQGHVFGFPVSGYDYPGATVLVIEQTGPALWTGGAFGPEAGLVGILAILVGALLTYGWLALRYGHPRLDLSLAQYARRTMCMTPER